MQHGKRVVALVLAGVLSLTVTAAAQDFMASSKSKKFHTASCRFVKRIKKENLVIFATIEEAKAAGYKACKKCCPEFEPPVQLPPE